MAIERRIDVSDAVQRRLDSVLECLKGIHEATDFETKKRQIAVYDAELLKYRKLLNSAGSDLYWMINNVKPEMGC